MPAVPGIPFESYKPWSALAIFADHCPATLVPVDGVTFWQLAADPVEEVPSTPIIGDDRLACLNRRIPNCLTERCAMRVDGPTYPCR